MPLVLQGKQGRNEAKFFDDEIDALIDKVLEYKCENPTRHKNFFKDFDSS